MQIDSDNLLLGILAFVGSTIVGMVTALWRKVTGAETRAALLEQAQAHLNAQREEDRADRAETRKSLEHRIDLHHRVVVEKVDGLSSRVSRLETTVKNGHG